MAAMETSVSVNTYTMKSVSFRTAPKHIRVFGSNRRAWLRSWRSKPSLLWASARFALTNTVTPHVEARLRVRCGCQLRTLAKTG